MLGRRRLIFLLFIEYVFSVFFLIWGFGAVFIEFGLWVINIRLVGGIESFGVDVKCIKKDISLNIYRNKIVGKLIIM